jgi:hypothetical protein
VKSFMSSMPRAAAAAAGESAAVAAAAGEVAQQPLSGPAALQVLPRDGSSPLQCSCNFVAAFRPAFPSLFNNSPTVKLLRINSIAKFM